MKSYLQGMITGDVLVFATIVLMGQNKITQEDLDEIRNKNKPRWDEALSYLELKTHLKEMGNHQKK